VSETAVMTLTSNGVVTNYQSYTGSTQSQVYLESKDLDLGTSDQEKYLDVIVLDITYPQGDDTPRELYLSWCLKDRMDDAEVWEDQVRIFDEDFPVFDIRETTRYIKLKIIDYFPVTIWQLARIIFYGELVGGRY
jgi:hypothetical protein